MDRQLRVAVAGAAMVLLSAGAVAIDARADSSASPAGPPATSLLLTIVPKTGAGHSVTLTCPAGGGTHPHAKDACAALDTASGDIDKVPPTTGEMCPHLVRPISATATGTYQNQPLSWSKSFNNTCELQRATHPLFDF